MWNRIYFRNNIFKNYLDRKIIVKFIILELKIVKDI